MTIYYLYVKTHNITGLKYLGKTSRKNPYSYPGSGKDWKQHLKKYGNLVTTEILHKCNSQREVGELGRYYSALWRVTTAMDDYGNKIWANIIPETGGGYAMTQEATAKWLESKKRNGTMNVHSPASIAKQLETKERNGTFYCWTEESIKKSNATKKKNGTDRHSLETIEKIRSGNIGKKLSPESIAKRTATRKANNNGFY